MGKWLAIANESLREEHIRTMLRAQGTDWETASHVTATTSLAQAIRAEGEDRAAEPALPIATLIDLIVMPGLEGDSALSLEGYPHPSLLRSTNLQQYGEEVDAWQGQVAGRRMRMGIRFDDSLRRFVRESAKNDPAGRVLVRARRELGQSIQTLIAAGVRPGDLEPQDAVGKLAIAAWRELELHVPELAAVRKDLWVDWKAFEEGSNAHARDLRQRVLAALDRAFGRQVGERRTIVYHGFYFFTPPQWAAFQLLRRLDNVDQIFLVHDDGRSRVFESWRRYFNEKWLMPTPEIARAGGGVTIQAAALRDALDGEHVDSESLTSSLRVLECRSPAELVREWRHESIGADADGRAVRRYAADAKSINRFVRRLGKATGSGGLDLAQLPIGAFLLALHDCIYPLVGGGYAIRLTAESVLDIAASGYLDVRGLGRPTAYFVPAVRRALPFFGGCVTGADWVDRGEVLRRLVLDEVGPLGGRSAGLNDVERLRLAATNPLRLAPWADLSREEAEATAAIVESIVALAQQIAGRERVVLRDHLNFVRTKLHAGMRELPEAERAAIAQKVDGFSVGLDEEIDVEGLVDVVSMLLGRTPEFDDTQEVGTSADAVRELRSLDALSLRRLAEDVHITNLADGTFPGKVGSVSWPFHAEDLQSPNAGVSPIAAEILAARAETAALSDLYLLWLALDGVTPGSQLTLSWISDMAGEPRNPSSLLSMLTLPRGTTTSVRERAGGLRVDDASGARQADALSQWPSPRTSTSLPHEVAQAAALLDPAAAAASHACPRRFVLQWALGPSPAFQSDHHHAMLYGNEVGALVRLRGLGLFEAFRACNDLWRFLTPGQRASSLARARVKTTKASAHGRWVLTLAGKKNGKDPLDLAYQAAVANAAPRPDVLAPQPSQYLPDGVNDPSVCNSCPVRSRCLSWERPD